MKKILKGNPKILSFFPLERFSGIEGGVEAPWVCFLVIFMYVNFKLLEIRALCVSGI